MAGNGGGRPAKREMTELEHAVRSVMKNAGTSNSIIATVVNLLRDDQANGLTAVERMRIVHVSDAWIRAQPTPVLAAGELPRYVCPACGRKRPLVVWRPRGRDVQDMCAPCTQAATGSGVPHE